MTWAKHVAKNYRKELRGRATSAELLFKRFLDRCKFAYCFQEIIMRKGKRTFYIVDFFIKMKPRVLIEIDGSSHVGRNAEDRDRHEYILKTKKYRDCVFIRFTNRQVFSGAAQIQLGRMFPKQIAKLNYDTHMTHNLWTTTQSLFAI